MGWDVGSASLCFEELNRGWGLENIPFRGYLLDITGTFPVWVPHCPGTKPWCWVGWHHTSEHPATHLATTKLQ